MKRLLEQVMKDNEEKNKKIEDLQKEVEEMRKETPSVHGDTDDEEDEKSDDEHEKEKPPGNDGAGTYTEKQLHDLIANTIKSQLGEGSSNNLRYVKPYTKRIDALRMPSGYQPPKFQQFDGKGNPKQHIAHFVETCNNAGTDGDLLVKQFVRSLKGIAFDWYTDLDSESIDSWDRMEDEFLNRFYSTRRIVSMSELKNTTQWEDEPVVEYINRWRALSLECKDRLSEASAVEMCINGMNWDLFKSRPTPFKAPVEKKEFKKTDKNSKGASKETMIVTTSTTPVKISANPKLDKKKETSTRNSNQNRLTLQELQAKKYPFPDSDLSGMLDDLLEKEVIQLPEPKRPNQVNKTNDPNYYRYHRMVSHPLEKCITLKDKIMQLAKDGKIILDLDETPDESSTLTSQKMNLQDKGEWCMHMIQFGSLEPVILEVRRPLSSVQLAPPSTISISESIEDVDNDEGWILVTRKKSRTQPKDQSQSMQPLYVSGYIRVRKVNRIMIDGGSGVNLMPKSTMIELGITMDELSTSRTVIHGFNLNGERAIGIIRVNLSMGDLSSETLFHVIDVKTSFKLLLGRPWKHENGVVASTLHQCLKYYREGEKKINGDVKPFTKADSFFADARFFKENGTSSEIMPTTISSTGKESKVIRNDSSSSMSTNDVSPVSTNNEGLKSAPTSSKATTEQEKLQTNGPPILRYVPKSRRKEGECPFAAYEESKPTPKEEIKSNRVVRQEWMVKVVTPLSGATKTQIAKPPITESTLFNKKSSDEKGKGVYDPNAYKLLAKAGYDFDNPTPLGTIIKAEPYGLNKTQKELFKKEGNFVAAKPGLGYESPPPVRISERVSVFKRLGAPSRSVFSRLGSPDVEKSCKDFQVSFASQEQEELRESGGSGSSFPSRIRRVPVKNTVRKQPLKIKTCVVAITSQKKFSRVDGVDRSNETSQVTNGKEKLEGPSS
ncbi:hypothetical protein RND81_08G097900 [Saponaria officinalis]|uniref:Retrotransposon gag domain-containing protein n=1 Tax=Saponaria officinalis TaxID=3572 RepID=A0AAW1J5K5_SAPOF